ncbi:MAG: LysR substrate-binding domain-containing protein, partial [Myxococcota bacterium]
RTLEEQLDERLFSRQGRSLVLTEAGRIALSYADEIFAASDELVATLTQGRSQTSILRVGAVATLSRNFQNSFLAPLLDSERVRLRIQSGLLTTLLQELSHLQIDLVLSNRPVERVEGHPYRCRRMAQQQVSLVGRPGRPLKFPEELAKVPLLLPSPDSEIRSAFDTLCKQLEVQAPVLAEVDDMAMMRLLARDSGALALLPSVVVRDELESGLLREYWVVPGLYENFYAITVERRFGHPLLELLLSQGADELLGRPGGS